MLEKYRKFQFRKEAIEGGFPGITQLYIVEVCTMLRMRQVDRIDAVIAKSPSGSGRDCPGT